jgi:hypothetical protein
MAPLGQICSTPLLRHELQGQTLFDGETDLLSGPIPVRSETDYLPIALQLEPSTCF